MADGDREGGIRLWLTELEATAVFLVAEAADMDHSIPLSDMRSFDPTMRRAIGRVRTKLNDYRNK